MAYVKGTHPGGETLDYSDGITDGDDQIIGNAGSDHIHAGGGNDVLKGGGGADMLDGGAGFDYATYQDSNAGVDVNLATNVAKGGTAQGDTFFSIEGLEGSNYDDKLTGDSHDNVLKGADGNDVLKGGGGADALYGGNGNDVMV